MVIVGIVALFFMGLFVLASINNPAEKRKEIERKVKAKKNNIERKTTDLYAYTTIFNNHNRILQDSIRIIETTENIDVLERRINDALEQLNWIISEKENGKPITSEIPLPQMLCNFKKDANSEIYRVSLSVFTKWTDKCRSCKTSRAQENSTIKAFKDIDRLLQLIQDTEDKNEVISDVMKFRNLIEDTYSDNFANL